MQDYDVDGGVMPGTATLDIQCHDTRGLSDNAILYVTIQDANDNAPVFKNSFYNVSIDSATKPNTLVTTVSAKDLDGGKNGQLWYSIAGIGLGQEYFKINSVGNVKLRKSMTFTNDRIFEFTILADDFGFPSLRGYTRVAVEFTKTAYDVTSAALEVPCYFCTMGGIAVFTLLMVILAFLLLLGGYMVFHYCIRNAMERQK